MKYQATRHLLALTILLLIELLGKVPAQCAPLTYSVDPVSHCATIEGLVPVKRFMGINLPKGSIEFDDGTLAVNIVPNWNFDRVALLQGPIIRTDVIANDKGATLAGIVLFTQGYWYDKYFPPASQETVVTTSGSTVTGKISDMTTTTLTVTPSAGGALVVIPLADVKEVHSPRAYAFSVPALAGAPIATAPTWTVDAQTVSLAPTNAGPAAATPVAFARRDPLLVTNDRAEGDWSNKKMFAVGSLLTLGQLTQMAPIIGTAAASPSTWRTILRDTFRVNQQTLTPNALPLINGHTYSLPGLATH